MTKNEALAFDRNLALLCERERYFAPSFQAARTLMDAVTVGAGGLTFPSGAVAGPLGCTCGNRACLHQVAWRIFEGGRR
jgi:hypothetical protein